MKLSLSVRVAESFRDKRQATMSLDELADLAVSEGYHALCMRASQLGTHTPLDEVIDHYQNLSSCGLAVSMVTGDFPIPENTDESTAALQNITPYLDLAAALHADLLRISMKKEEDIPWAQRAADEAAERGMRLAHQCHNASLFEQVDISLDVLRRIDRANFGIIYEPANLELCAQDYGVETLKRFGPYMFNVYLQNQRLGPDGKDVMKTWCQGDVPFDQIPVWAPDGIDFARIMAGLEELGYTGYVTIHQASAGLGGAAEAARETTRFLRSLAAFEAPLN
jgi:sugar phosphate isomerase/epimerase